MSTALKRSLLLLLFCLHSAAAADPLRVIVSILPQAEFVERVGGDRVAVTVMLPPGAGPPTYDPKPSQLKAVENAHLYVQIGADFICETAWMDKIRALNPHLTIARSDEGIDLLHGHSHHGHPEATDPHIWLSPQCAKIIVANICRALSDIDPDHAAFYVRNRDAYSAELDSLHAFITQTLGGPRAFMIYHPAWAYFARDYNLEQIAIENEGKDPTPRGIAHLIRKARSLGLTTVFASPQYNTKSAEVIARELGGRVVLISPLERDYIKNMRRVARAIAEQ